MSTSARVEPLRVCDGAAAVLELGPAPANLLDRAQIRRITEQLEVLADEPELRAIVVRGSGGHFCYGASVPEHLPGQVEAMLPEFHALLRAFDHPRLPPVIASVRGRCLGGGLELALVCDQIFAAEGSSLGCPEIKLGVFPPAGIALLPLRVSAARALELATTGRIVTGAEAHAIGLVEHLAPADALDDAVESWIRTQWLPLSGAALRQARYAARAPFRAVLQERLAELEGQYLGPVMSTEDAREGLNAFLEKRAPRWSHR